MAVAHWWDVPHDGIERQIIKGSNPAAAELISRPRADHHSIGDAVVTEGKAEHDVGRIHGVLPLLDSTALRGNSFASTVEEVLFW